jgi:hypothetical protein
MAPCLQLNKIFLKVTLINSYTFVLMLTSKKYLLLTFHFVFLSSALHAQLQTKSVSIFKNNKSFFIKSASVSPVNNQYFLGDEIPRALFGTLWFQSSGSGIKQVSSIEQNIEKTVIPASMYEMLKANLNKKVTLFLSATESVEGQIASFSKDYDEESKTYFVPAYVYLSSLNNSVGMVSIKIEDVKRVSFSGKPVNEVKSFIKKKVVSVEFNENKPNQTLNMMYLEDGLGWSPNYLLELTSETKGIMTLQAQVKNDAEDLKNADLSFVAGVANFKNTNTLAWLVDFLPGVYGDYNSPDVATQFSNSAIGYKSAESDETAPSTSGDGVDGEATEDLYFYNLKNITLPKGSRSQIELFKAEVALEHTYEVRITDMNAYGIENYVFPVYGTEDNTAKTFHSVKLVNQTKYPWTSGLCFVVNKETGNSKPLSQDILAYTPMKGDVSLKLTESPDIKVTHSEKEIDRKTAVKRNREIQYDLITVEAEIKINNYKSKAVNMNVKRLVLGELLKTSTNWKLSEKINYNSSLNKSTDITWSAPVKAGGELIIKYSYKLIVRAN